MLNIDRPNLEWDRVEGVYADGGCILGNPSKHGGTWAFCYTTGPQPGARLYGGSGVVRPDELELPVVTNNVTELLALVIALEQLPIGWTGPVHTDSLNALNRVHFPDDAKFKNVPGFLVERTRAATKRLGKLRFVLVGGHPTKGELQAGQNEHGMPVSIHNVWCDGQCQDRSKEFRRTIDTAS